MSLSPVERAHITDEHLREWKNENPSFKLPEPVPMREFLYELCSTMVRGEFPFQKCKVALDSVQFLEKVSEQELASSFADILTRMSHDEEFPWEAEMIKIKAQEPKSEEVRVNTHLLYLQTKFNYLQEGNMGYTKLVTLLCQNPESSSNNAAATIKSLIRHFDLDPNNVFDIVLECCELLPDNNVLLELIPIFSKSHASQTLGIKFQHYQRLDVMDQVPFGLYKLTALLVKENFIDLESTCAHLLLKVDEAFERYSALCPKQLDEANKIGKINLAAAGKDLMEDEKQGDVSKDLFASLDMDSEAVGERSTKFEINQTLGLLTGFLAVDDWYHAHILFDHLSPLNPIENIQICNSLFRLIEKSISSAYTIVRQARLVNLGSSGTSVGVMTTENSPTNGSSVELDKELFQMLATVGPYLYRDTLLLQKVCRVLRGYYLSATELGRTGEGAVSISIPRLPIKEARSSRQVVMNRIEEALRMCLLPSLQLVPANPAVGMELWEVMSLLPYEVRYRLYGEWEKEDERIPIVLDAKQTAKFDTRRILQGLAEENLKQRSRMIAKLAHAHPMTVLRTIVHQVEEYKYMITTVVDALKYLTQLEYDVLEYVVIERLVLGGRDTLKEDGLNMSDGLPSLALFWGQLCEKYPSMELRGLFQYLVNQMKRGQVIKLVVLEDFIQQVANVREAYPVAGIVSTCSSPNTAAEVNPSLDIGYFSHVYRDCQSRAMHSDQGDGHIWMNNSVIAEDNSTSKEQETEEQEIQNAEVADIEVDERQAHKREKRARNRRNIRALDRRERDKWQKVIQNVPVSTQKYRDLEAKIQAQIEAEAQAQIEAEKLEAKKLKTQRNNKRKKEKRKEKALAKGEEKEAEGEGDTDSRQRSSSGGPAANPD